MHSQGWLRGSRVRRLAAACAGVIGGWESGAAASDLVLLDSTPLPPGVTPSEGVAVDPNGYVWVIDGGVGRAVQLSQDGQSVLTEKDFSNNDNHIDIAADGRLFLTRPLPNVLHVYAPDLVTEVQSANSNALGITSLDAIALDQDESVWVLDATAQQLHHFNPELTSSLSSFALPAGIATARDVALATDGTLLVAASPAVSGEAIYHLRRTGSLIERLDFPPSGGVAAASAIAVDPNGDILVVDTGASSIFRFAGPAPTLESAVYSDSAAPAGVSAGDRLILQFDQAVSAPGSFEEDDLTVSEDDNSSAVPSPQSGPSPDLGNFTVQENPRHRHQLLVTLGTDARLSLGGEDGHTHLDITCESGDIVDPITGARVRDGGGVRILRAFSAPAPAEIGAAGGTLGARSSDGALHDGHRLTIPAGALSGPVTVTMGTMPEDFDASDAITVSPVGLLAASGSVELRLEYDPEATNFDRDGDEPGLRIHQLIETESGWQALPLPGRQTVDTRNNLITATLANLASGAVRHGAGGDVGIFATLPLDSVDDRSITITRSAAARHGLVAASLNAGPNGAYTQHAVTFPGYELAASGVTVTLRDANLFERYSFPPESGAVFTLEVNSGILEHPLDVRVQFHEEDLWSLNSAPGLPHQMRLAWTDDLEKPIAILPGPQEIDSSHVRAAVPTTAHDGVLVFGATVDPSAVLQGLLLR